MTIGPTMMGEGRLREGEAKGAEEKETPAGGADGKGYRRGTHRAVQPAETIARVTPLMQRMGITRVANVTGLDRIGIPVVLVIRPNSRSVSVSQGKGLDLEAAMASGLMESLETWHAERITLPVKYATYAELGRDHAMVEVAALPKMEGSRFHPQRRLLWIEGRNLIDDGSTWLPYEMVHSDYTHPLPAGHGCFPSDTNGLASGNHFREACCHAICEVIERDATSVWHHRPHAQRERTRIDLETIDDADARALIERFEAAGIAVTVWNTTTDLGVPAFYCLITDREKRLEHIGEGAGCHPARDVALLRALSEAAQTRMTYITGSRDDLMSEEFTPGGIGEKLAATRRLIGRGAASGDYRQCPDRELDTFEADLDWLNARLGAIGLSQVVAVDLSKPDIGLAVVRVVIPGLEAPHDDEDYIPGPRARAAMEGRA
jgi:ribosomal protein S12 methylthiotransferase accessory factor